eukprot:TRINITY_DN6584_c0_g1_i2.p1 TRINITY_DN6584_c0_g1~~TRINITY_DN6584_c0_g1_i2.p1  ORF type:complete len:181 (-),score=30.75 TRINITY_DN6584_c0_g1_i2:13-498(-)
MCIRDRRRVHGIGGLEKATEIDIKSSHSYSGSVKALVIDDDQFSIVCLTKMLKELNIQCIGISDPYQGLAYFKDHYSELRYVFLDHHMPGINGPDLLQELRREIRNSINGNENKIGNKIINDHKFVLCSGDDQKFEEFDGQLKKPVFPNDLKELISSLIFS